MNMGYPVNTTDDDIFFSPVNEGYIAYQSKFDDKGFGQQDILRLEVFSDDHPRRFLVRGLVTLRDLINSFKDSVKISAFSKLDMDTILVVYSDPETGEYEFEIPHGEYSLLFESPGSEKSLEEINLALIHPGDSISIPKKVLPKADFLAELGITSVDSTTKYQQGDTALINLNIEPYSILTVEHWVGDSLYSTEEYIVNSNEFSYAMIPETGDNRFVFTSRDRFDNSTTQEHRIVVPEKRVIRPTDVTIDPDKIIALNEGTEAKIKDEVIAQDPSIDSMSRAISKATGGDPAMQDAIDRASEKSIRNAGEWLETLYSVAIGDGTDKELLLRLIAAMSASDGMSANDFLDSLATYADGNLSDFMSKLNIDQLGLETPEEVIDYLISNSANGGYTPLELFETLARMISHENKTAEEIIDYFDKSERNRLWILWLLIGSSVLTLFIIVYRKRKKEADKG
jgi:hypothetical protein